MTHPAPNSELTAESVCNICSAPTPEDQLIDWNGIELCPACDAAERKAWSADGFIVPDESLAAPSVERELPPELDVPCPPEAKEAVRRGVAMAEEFARTGSVRLAAPSVEREEPSKEDIDKFKSWFQLKPSPKPDVAGARERLLGCADDDERHWSLDPREGWAVDVPVADLRLILSAYDRQADLIERLIQNVKREFADRERAEAENDRQAEEIERLRGALESIADDDEPEPGNRNTNDLLARMYWEIATKATRARQGGPDHG